VAPLRARRAGADADAARPESALSGPEVNRDFRSWSAAFGTQTGCYSTNRKQSQQVTAPCIPMGEHPCTGGTTGTDITRPTFENYCPEKYLVRVGVVLSFYFCKTADTVRRKEKNVFLSSCEWIEGYA